MRPIWRLVLDAPTLYVLQGTREPLHTPRAVHRHVALRDTPCRCYSVATSINSAPLARDPQDVTTTPPLATPCVRPDALTP